jgi:two-component system NarL family response regulator
MTKPVSIMVVDDHAIVRQGIAALIERQPDMAVVAEAGTGAEALALHGRHRPDVTLIDLRLPDMDGALLMRRLRADEPTARFVVLSAHESAEDVYQAVRAGAAGYVLKGAPGQHLIEAVRAVHGGEQWLPAALASRIAQHVARVELTERESAVLALMVAGKTNKEIGADLGVDESTVKTHVTAIFKKLGVSSRTQAIVAAIQSGLVRIGP